MGGDGREGESEGVRAEGGSESLKEGEGGTGQGSNKV